MAQQVVPDIQIPVELLPQDGRFGCGPSRIRDEAVAHLAGAARAYLGTSHRQPGVRSVVGRIPVAHRDAAVGWYERLVGRPPDLVPNDDEAAWRLTETGCARAVRRCPF